MFAYYVSVSCNHCEKPACLMVCPVKAITKDADTGLVTIDETKCTNCKKCIDACPYHAPQEIEATMKVDKCDGCASRVAKGALPVCVEACPQRALDFGDMTDLMKKHAYGDHIAPLPDPSMTTPHLLVQPGSKARPVGDTKGVIANPTEVL
jgi:anaerobic dimethyl sulfoxide reductase subunit B (iron-sulfur subunit)